MGKYQKRIPATYKILNNLNNHIYIGSTFNFARRKSQHLYDLRNDFHHSSTLQNAFNSYKEESFEFRIIREYKESTEQKKLREYEQKLMDKFNPEYNMSKTAINIPTNPIPVVKLSPTNKILDYYNSIVEANLSMGKDAYDSGISSVLHGRTISFNKFKWVNNKDRKSRAIIEEESKMRGDKINPIQQIDINTGEVINEGYMSLFKELGICPSAISEVIQGDRKTHKGFIYRNYEPYPTKKYIVACDTGKKGGIVILDLKGNLVFKTPIFIDYKNEYDIDRITNYLSNHKDYIISGSIEKIHSIFGTGKSTAFKMGFGYGIMVGIFAGLSIEYTSPNPKEWQSTAWMGIPRDKDTKVTSLNAVKLLFKDIDFKVSDRHRIFHDGMVDAALIGIHHLKELNKI